MNGPSEQDEADLAALADGALYGPRRAELQRRLAADPHLVAAYERQCAAVRLLASCHDRAPLSLRLRVEELQARPRAVRRWWPAAALAFAATVAAFLVLLAGRGPAVEDVLAVTFRPATAPADGRPLGEWSPTGARTDVIDGREVRTVFYDRDGRTIAYAIVAGPALSEHDALRTVRAGDVVAVTWTRDGRTCVIAAVGADPEALARLAVW
jgi:anti-sigma factor RsiW